MGSLSINLTRDQLPSFMQVQKSDILLPGQLPINLGDGNEMVFSGIFERYYSALCIFAERMVGEENAKDVIEEMFVRLWDKQIQLAGEEHLKAFLYHTAKNTCLNFIKSDLKANKRNTIYAKGLPEVEECYLTEVTRTELIRQLHSAIADLPLQCSRIIHLSYVEGLKNAVIADKLGLSVQTVKNQKMRGIGLLKKRLPGDQFLLFLLLIQHLS